MRFPFEYCSVIDSSIVSVRVVFAGPLDARRAAPARSRDMEKLMNDEAGVNAVVHRFEDAWNRHDMEDFAKLFASDADFVNVIGMRWIGREEIKKSHVESHATMFKSSTLEIGTTTLRFLKEDIATARSAWRLSGITFGAGQTAPPRSGILTNVLVRIGEHWLIVLTQNTDITKPIL